MKPVDRIVTVVVALTLSTLANAQFESVGEREWVWRGAIAAGTKPQQGMLRVPVPFQAVAGGGHEVTMVSREFDAFLQLERGGKVLASDDDGLFGPPIPHARIRAELEKGVAYTVVAGCRVPFMNGRFEVRIRRVAEKARSAPSVEDIKAEFARVRAGFEPRYRPGTVVLPSVLFGYGQFLEGKEPDPYAGLAGFLTKAIREAPAARREKLCGIYAGFLGNILRERVDVEAASRLLQAVEPAFVGSSRIAFLEKATIWARSKEAMQLASALLATRPRAPFSGLSARQLGLAYGLWARELETSLVRGDAAAAIAGFRELERVLDGESELAGRRVGLRNDFGHTLIDRGYFREAERVLEAARNAMSTADRAAEPNLYGAVLLNLARAVQRRGALTRAELMIREALALPGAKDFPDFFVGRARNNLGNLLRAIGKIQAAQLELEAARDYFAERKQPGLVAIAWNNLGRVLSVQKKHAEALAAYERGLAGMRAADGARSWKAGVAMLNVAAMHRRLGDASKALDAAKRSREVLAPQSAHFARLAGVQECLALEAAGEHLDATRRLAEILAGQEKSLGEHHTRVLDTIEHLVRLELKLGDRSAARKLGAKLVERSLEATAVQLSMAPIEDQFYLSKQHWKRLGVLASLGPPDEVLFRSCSAWKGMVYRVSRLWGDRGRGLREQIPELAGLERLDAEIVRLIHYPASGDADAHVERLQAAQQKRRALQQKAFAKLNRAHRFAGLSLADTHAKVPARTAVVDFYVLPKWRVGSSDFEAVGTDAVMFVLNSANAAAKRVDLGDYSKLEEALQAFTFKVAGGQRGRRYARARDNVLERFQKQFVAKFLPELRRAQRLVIVPDGAFGETPIEAIEIGSKRLFEFTVRGISYYEDIPGFLRDSGKAPEREAATTRLLAVGDVDYGEPAADQQAKRDLHVPLPHSKDEVTRLAMRFRSVFPGGRAVTLTGAEATTQRFLRAAAERPRFIHLATHGFFEGDGLLALLSDQLASFEEEEEIGIPDVTQSRGNVASTRATRFVSRIGASAELLHPGAMAGVVFAGANRPPDDAVRTPLLSAARVSLLALDRCDLVVLSGCETSLGQKEIGEGMQSLLRAFRVAGARCVVGSLWKVDDGAAREFMDLFYRSLWSGKAPAVALRVAKRGLQLSKERRHRDPRQWAAWILSGR